MQTADNADTSFPEEQLTECRARLAAVEKAFMEAENRAQKYAQEQRKWTEWQHSQQNNFQRLQADYENLRVQKGGFGFKSLLACGTVSAFAGALLCFLFFRPTDQHVQAFEQFRREELFSIEYALSEGRFDEVEKSLHAQRDLPHYRPIHAEIEALRKLVTAAKRGCH